MNKDYIVVIGGGLAGSEAALQIAKQNIKVKLYEMKPVKFSPAHSNEDFAEIVCSNSFKSNLLTNACGLLKEELRRLGSFLIRTADEVQVPAGQALAVDRDEFAKKITELIESNKNIEVIKQEVVSKFDDSIKDNDVIFFEDLIKDNIVIVATGPLTSSSLSIGIQHLTGNDSLYFF